MKRSTGRLSRMSEVVHKPDRKLSEPDELLLGFLDYYRSVIARKVEGLTEAQLRTAKLPSGWTPLELVKHLLYMERRWFRWGFTAEQVSEPFGDMDEARRWHLEPEDTSSTLIAALRAEGEHTRLIVNEAELDEVGAVGGRFSEENPPPTLAWILIYVLQEYARHAGHLDVARELIDNVTGE
jgi:Protein of unknown function (DUF664)